MSFLVYLAVLVIAVASALFGLDLLTSPLSQKTVPQVVSTNAPNKPIPANPAGTQDVRMVYPPSQETTGASNNSGEKRLVPRREPSAPTAAVAPAQAQTETSPAEPPAAPAVTEQTSNRCNVNACAAAYQSFQASDCTYQPLNGPRRICTKSLKAAQPRNVDRANPTRERATRRIKQRTADDADNDDRQAPGRRVIFFER